MLVPHSLTLLEVEDLICVADRGNLDVIYYLIIISLNICI